MIEFIVIGSPGPQGSKSFRGMSKAGRAILTEVSAKVKPWREAVKWAALKKSYQAKIPGPITLEIVFSLKCPKGKNPKVHVPETRPDSSKLLRSTEDAITDAGLWQDDSRVIRTIMEKVYAGSGLPHSLDVPGAWIRIRPYKPYAD